MTSWSTPRCRRRDWFPGHQLSGRVRVPCSPLYCRPTAPTPGRNRWRCWGEPVRSDQAELRGGDGCPRAGPAGTSRRRPSTAVNRPGVAGRSRLRPRSHRQERAGGDRLDQQGPGPADERDNPVALRPAQDLEESDHQRQAGGDGVTGEDDCPLAELVPTSQSVGRNSATLLASGAAGARRRMRRSRIPMASRAGPSCAGHPQVSQPGSEDRAPTAACPATVASRAIPAVSRSGVVVNGNRR